MKVNFDDYGRAIVNGEKMDWKSNSDAINYALKNGHDGIDFIDGSFTDEPSIVFLKGNKVKIVDQGLD